MQILAFSSSLSLFKVHSYEPKQLMIIFPVVELSMLYLVIKIHSVLNRPLKKFNQYSEIWSTAHCGSNF